MRTFEDTAGRKWAVVITVDTIKRVRGLLNVDLLEITDGSLIEKLIRDPVLLCDVVYAVCQPEADQQGVSDVQFGQAMAGDAIERATQALLEELVDFSPSPRDRANLRQVLHKTYQVMDQARDLIEAKLSSAALDQAVAQALATAGDSSGSAPASAAVTPDR
jgi:hypothetical protein